VPPIAFMLGRVMFLCSRKDLPCSTAAINASRGSEQKRYDAVVAQATRWFDGRIVNGGEARISFQSRHSNSAILVDQLTAVRSI